MLLSVMCNSNTSVEQYYVYDNVTDVGGYYYLNTFDNILTSGGKTQHCDRFESLLRLMSQEINFS